MKWGKSMKSGMVKRGFTLIEMIITVAVIVILVSMVIGITKRIDDQNKERLCRNELAFIDNALEQFRDFGYNYKLNAALTASEMTFYNSLNFPPDCSVFNLAEFQDELIRVFDSSVAVISPDGTLNYPNVYSGCQSPYFFLSQVPKCKRVLEQIPSTALTNIDEAGNRMVVRVTTSVQQDYPLMRVVDPWGTPLRYDYYDETLVNPFNTSITQTVKNFPVITSAGPDGIFGNSDDIKNYEQ